MRSGLDVTRALALGANAAFAGKAFLYGLGAIGGEGAGYVIDMFKEEIRDTLRQCGSQFGEGCAGRFSFVIPGNGNSDLPAAAGRRSSESYVLANVKPDRN